MKIHVRLLFINSLMLLYLLHISPAPLGCEVPDWMVRATADWYSILVQQTATTD